MLVGRISGIKAVAAVRVQRQAGNRRIQAVAQSRPVIDVAVVARDRPGDGGVLVARVGVGNRNRRVVGPVSVIVSVEVDVAPCSSVLIVASG
ncbi:hypothetical protein AB7M75_004634 [Bradyrhizobium ottawaense]